MRDSLDLGLLPEADLRTRFGGRPEYMGVRQSPEAYPFDQIAAAADLANAMDPANRPRLEVMLKGKDPAVRYWAATGLGALGKNGQSAAGLLRAALDDPASIVRAAAADALCRLERYEAVPALGRALEDENPWVRLYAMNVLDRINGHAQPVMDAIRKTKEDKNQYVVRVVEHVLGK
jgi:HEAT repeat protein